MFLLSRRHLQRKHPGVFKEYTDEGVKPDPTQLSIASMFGGDRPSDAYGPKHPQQIKCNESLVSNLIVSCGIAISVVEKPAFRAFKADINPKLVLPSRQHITYKMLPKLADRTRATLQKVLDSSKHVALTLDIWTDRSTHSFLAITAHTFVACTPLSCLLTFASFTGSHTGARIAEEIDRSITDNRLEGKVSFIVTDNASNMKRAIEVLKDVQETSEVPGESNADEGVLDDETMWEDMEEQDNVDIQQTIDRQCSARLACFAHTLQLVVKDGLAKLTAAGVRLMMGKCTKLCNLVHQSALFRDAFECKFGQGRSLAKANDTRWNSTFRHLVSVADLDQVELAALLREQSQMNLIITPKEYAMLQELIDILQPFLEATDLTQGEKYPTIGCVVPSVIALDSCLLDMLSKAVHHVPTVRTLHESLRRRFLGLFQRLRIVLMEEGESQNDAFGSFVYPMASVLDPSYGFLWLEDHPGSPDVKQQMKDEIIG